MSSYRQSQAPRTVRSTAPPATNGIKRSVDGTVRNAMNNQNTNIITHTTPIPVGNHRDTMAKKLISNMRVYAHNIVNEARNIVANPERAQLLIAYESQKMVVASQMVEDLVGKFGSFPDTAAEAATAIAARQTTTPPDTPPELSMDDKIEAAVKRVIEGKLEALEERLFDNLYDSVTDIVNDCVGETVVDEFNSRRISFIDDVCDMVSEVVMDDEMLEVKETVTTEIKARKVLGDPQDTQDQQRAIGVGDIIG